MKPLDESESAIQAARQQALETGLILMRTQLRGLSQASTEGWRVHQVKGFAVLREFNSLKEVSKYLKRRAAAFKGREGSKENFAGWESSPSSEPRQTIGSWRREQESRKQAKPMPQEVADYWLPFSAMRELRIKREIAEQVEMLGAAEAAELGYVSEQADSSKD